MPARTQNGSTCAREPAALAAEEKMTGKDVVRAIKQCRIDVEKINPLGV